MLDKQGAATGTSSRKQAPAGSSRGGGGRRARGSGGRWESWAAARNHERARGRTAGDWPPPPLALYPAWSASASASTGTVTMGSRTATMTRSWEDDGKHGIVGGRRTASSDFESSQICNVLNEFGFICKFDFELTL